MNSPAQSIALLLWTRHRLGLKLSALILVLTILVVPSVLRSNPSITALALTSIPPVLILAHLMNALIFAREVGGMTSGYPQIMYALPVRTRVLVFWPMLFGAVLVTLVWLAFVVCVYRRGGYDPPLLFPAVALAVAMSWFQLLCWLPIESPVLRLLVAGLGTILLLAIPEALLLAGWVSPQTLAVLLLACLPVFFTLAVYGVGRDRRGDRLSLGLGPLKSAFGAAWHSLQPRASPDSPLHAQVWYEGQCHNLLILGMTAAMAIMVFTTACFMARSNVFGIRFAFGVLAALPFLTAGSQGGTLGRFRPFWDTRRGTNGFVFTRPISTGELLRAKFQMAAGIVVKTWVLTGLLMLGLALIQRGAGDLSEPIDRFFRLYPGWKGATILGTAIALAPLLHWKLLTDHLVPVLTGRRWLVEGSVLLGVALFFGLIGGGAWCADHPRVLPLVAGLASWFGAIVLSIKLPLTLAAFRLNLDRGLLKPSSVRRLIMGWSVAAALAALLTHLALPAAGLPAPRPVILLSSLALLPMARFALAPLALDWNRAR